MKDLKITFSSLFFLLIALSCENDAIDLSENFQENTIEIYSSKSVSNSKSDKVRLWHFDSDTSEWILKDINKKALQKHLGHGDRYIAPGDFMEGGVVIWVERVEKQHGLVISIEEQGRAEWGCYLQNIVGTSYEMGTGKNNTAIILENCDEEKIAARLAVNYRGGGYSDWFLPSSGEIHQLYVNDIYVNPTLKKYGGVLFINQHYWSSTQYRPELIGGVWLAGYAHDNFSSNIFSEVPEKFNALKVRAVREF